MGQKGEGKKWESKYLHGRVERLAAQLEFLVRVENAQFHEADHRRLLHARVRLRNGPTGFRTLPRTTGSDIENESEWRERCKSICKAF